MRKAHRCAVLRGTLVRRQTDQLILDRRVQKYQCEKCAADNSTDSAPFRNLIIAECEDVLDLQIFRWRDDLMPGCSSQHRKLRDSLSMHLEDACARALPTLPGLRCYQDPSSSGCDATLWRLLLLRVGNLQKLLAEVRAGEKPDDGLGRILQPVLQIDLVFDFALRVPRAHFADSLGKMLQELKYQEAFHPRAMQNETHVVLRARAAHPGFVVTRDRPAQHDARAVADARQRMIEDLAADVVEVDVDASRT